MNVLVSDDFTGWAVNWNDSTYHIPSHGDHVSVIINGGRLPDSRQKFVGIAPLADVTQKQYGRNTDLDGNLIDYSEFDIINLSNSGGQRTVTQAGLDDARAYRLTRPIHSIEKTLYVKSHGNILHDCTIGTTCTASSLNIIADANRAAQTLLVGRIDNHNQVVSAKAGVAKDSYVVDYGAYNMHWRDSNGQRQRSFVGTSASVPTVVGKAAIIKSKFPNMNGAQLASIIKNTADDLGAPGVDDVYGHGRVNLSRALSPIGTLR